MIQLVTFLFYYSNYNDIFAFVKQRGYAISLLLSFLAVLLHDMIPHHHHDMEGLGYELSFQSYACKINNPYGGTFHYYYDEREHHHGEVEHHHGEVEHHHGEVEHHHGERAGTENSHRNNFPLHHHHSVDNEFDYFKINLKRFLNPGLDLVAVLFYLNTFELSLPPEIDFIRFTDKPFLINPTFEPGATGLRAPPSIA